MLKNLCANNCNLCFTGLWVLDFSSYDQGTKGEISLEDYNKAERMAIMPFEQLEKGMG